MKSLKILFKKRKFPYSKIEITKQGILYIAILIIIGFASFNSGNNMIYLIFAITLSLFGVSSYLAVKNLSNISTKLEIPQEIYANRETLIVISLLNQEKGKKLLLDVELLGKKVHFDVLEKSEKRSIRLNFEKRGRYAINNVSLISSYPFNFFTRVKDVPINENFFVFPEIKEVRIRSSRPAGLNTLRESSDGDFYSIEDYKEGMDARRISWKISAKLGEEKIVSLAISDGGDVVVVFNNSKKLYNNESFEKAISKFASIVYKLYYQGTKFEFVSPKLDIVCNSYENYLKIMKCLSEAVLEDNEPTKLEAGISDEDIEFIQ